MEGFWGTLIVGLIVAAVVGFAAFKMVKNKLEGKSSCGCSCGSCPMAGKCHGEERADEGDNGTDGV